VIAAAAKQGIGTNSATRIFAVMLRDPGSRLVSALNFDLYHGRTIHSGVVARAAPKLAEKVRDRTASVQDLLNAAQSGGVRLNVATAMVVGKRSMSTTDRSDLEAAKARLVELNAVVGVFEHLAASYALLAAAIGSSANASFGSKKVLSCSNAGLLIGSRAVASAVQTDALRQQHNLDWELYQFGRTLFYKQWGERFGGGSKPDSVRLNCKRPNQMRCLKTPHGEEISSRAVAEACAAKQSQAERMVQSSVHKNANTCPERVCWGTCLLLKEH
jgi:hypothetical protein